MLKFYFVAFVPGTVLCARERSASYFAKYKEIKNEHVYPTLFQKRLEPAWKIGKDMADFQISKSFWSPKLQTPQVFSTFIHQAFIPLFCIKCCTKQLFDADRRMELQVSLFIWDKFIR